MLNYALATPTPTATQSQDVTMDASSSELGGSSSWSQATANQSNRIIIVELASSSNPTGITYGGQALTEIVSKCIPNCSSLWYKTGQSVGSFSVVISGAGTIFLAADQQPIIM